MTLFSPPLSFLPPFSSPFRHFSQHEEEAKNVTVFNAYFERKESNTESTMAAPAAPAAADASADMPTFKLVLVGDGGTGE